MSKYHELIKTYADEIAEIKALKGEYDGLIAKVNAIDPVVHPEPDWDALDEANEIYQIMCICYDKLQQDIEAEYYDVPFAKPRQAGIEGFWRESGLRGLFRSRKCEAGAQ